MPPARKPAQSSARKSAGFKEPAALKRLTQSLDAAHKALGDLRTQVGRNAATSTKTLHKNLGKFVSNARRDTGKFGAALKSDYDKAQSAITRAPARRAASTKAATSRSTRTSTAKSTSTAKRTTTARRTTRKAS